MGNDIIVKKDKRILYKKLFVGFFILMIILTILSKIIDSIVIPKVQVKAPTSGNLSYSVTGEGAVKASAIGFLDVPEGIKVDKVLQPGQKVNAGQGVVFLRISYLKEKKKKMERELSKMQLTMEREKLSGKAAARITQQETMAGDLAQAQKNLSDSQVKLQTAQAKYTQESEKLKKRLERDRGMEERRFSLSKEAVDKLNQVSGNQVPQNYSQAEIDYSAAISQLEDNYERLQEQLADTLAAAVTETAESQDSCNQMKYRADLAVKSDANTNQNEKTSAQISGKTQEILKVDVDAAKEELQKIEDLLQADGEVKAESAGVITGMGVTPGMVTSGNEIIEIGSGKFLFSGTLQKEDTGVLEEGDSIEISMPMQTKKVMGKITNISIKTDVQGGQKTEDTGTQGSASEAYAEFTAELEDGDYRIGSMAEYVVHKNSQLQYPCMIPLEAVREDGKGKYCLIAEKRSTILGEEEIAVRINIELLKKDAVYAAVNGAFGADERIITGGNKAIAEGDRVRIQP